MSDELSCGQARDWHTHTDTQTHRRSRWQYPKPKLASGNKPSHINGLMQKRRNSMHILHKSYYGSRSSATAIHVTQSLACHGAMDMWTSSARRIYYSDVIMGAMASQITSLTFIYPTVYSGANQRKHQISPSLAFVRGIHRWPVNSPHKMPVTVENVSMYKHRLGRPIAIKTPPYPIGFGPAEWYDKGWKKYGQFTTSVVKSW